MASAIWHNVTCRERARRSVGVTFYPQGTGAPVVTDRVDGVASVTRTDVGVFLVSYSFKFKGLVVAHHSLQHVTAVALWTQLGTISNLGADALVTASIRIIDASATPTDMAANANSSVSLTLDFYDTVQ